MERDDAIPEPSGSTVTSHLHPLFTNDNVTNTSYTGDMTSDNSSLDLIVTQQPGSKFGELEKYPEFWAAYYLNKYYLNIIAAFGFPGNILSFITILKMKPHSHPSIYVAVLAVSDNFCLAAKILFTEVTRHDVDVGSYGCKFLYFAGNTTAIYANWLLVLMTVERFMAIWFPLKVGSFCTRRRSGVAMVCLLVMVGSLCSAFFVFSTDLWRGDDFLCIFHQDYLPFVSYVWYWVDATFYALLPCVLLAMFNTLIIVGIKRAASIQRQLTEADSSSRSKRLFNQATEKIRQQRQITIMLVVVCVVFVVLTLPNCIFFIYKPYWNPTPRTRQDAKFRVIEQIVYLLSDLSHATNFFVYFFSTKKFRDRFLETVCCCRKWRRHMTRSSHVGQSQFSETGSIYVSSFSNGGGAIPLHLRGSNRY
ncbi:delta-type opioid receptor-like isoform X2 [Babylonia areolata]